MTEGIQTLRTAIYSVVWTLFFACLIWPGTVLTAKASDMALVEGGTFTMGDTIGNGYDDEKPTRRATISSFYMGKHEVTFAEYDVFCAASGRKMPDDAGWGRGTRPVINVTWHDAIAYCNWRSREAGLAPAYSGNDDSVTCDLHASGYRLPTEAEWEYAAKGGRKSRGYQYSGSNDINDVAWHDGNARGMTQPVGQKQPNELGLYDMSGNVYEWCWDWYNSYQQGGGAPLGLGAGTHRVIRGGSWYFYAGNMRSARRLYFSPSICDNDLGFRILRPVILGELSW